MDLVKMKMQIDVNKKDYQGEGKKSLDLQVQYKIIEPNSFQSKTQQKYEQNTLPDIDEHLRKQNQGGKRMVFQKYPCKQILFDSQNFKNVNLMEIKNNGNTLIASGDYRKTPRNLPNLRLSLDLNSQFSQENKGQQLQEDQYQYFLNFDDFCKAQAEKDLEKNELSDEQNKTQNRVTQALDSQTQKIKETLQQTKFSISPLKNSRIIGKMQHFKKLEPKIPKIQKEKENYQRPIHKFKVKNKKVNKIEEDLQIMQQNYEKVIINNLKDEIKTTRARNTSVPKVYLQKNEFNLIDGRKFNSLSPINDLNIKSIQNQYDMQSTLRNYQRFYQQKIKVKNSKIDEVQELSKVIKTLQSQLSQKKSEFRESQKQLQDKKQQSQIKAIFDYYSKKMSILAADVLFLGHFMQFCKDFQLIYSKNQSYQPLNRVQIIEIFKKCSSFNEMSFEQFILALNEIAAQLCNKSIKKEQNLKTVEEKRTYLINLLQQNTKFQLIQQSQHATLYSKSCRYSQRTSLETSINEQISDCYNRKSQNGNVLKSQETCQSETGHFYNEPSGQKFQRSQLQRQENNNNIKNEQISKFNRQENINHYKSQNIESNSSINSNQSNQNTVIQGNQDKMVQFNSENE